MAEKEPCVVLVTGGSGFLGQHVVGLLQAHADHVTEIRVLDMVPYENKLDYKSRKPLRSIVGSVTDEQAVQEACRGVNSVIHIAGIPDSNMFPDKDKINDVNVKGTLVTLLTALSTPGVQRFIYCSSMSVAIGNADVTGVICEADSIPKRRLFEPYASSKIAGERIVLAANSDSFRAIVLRPLVMWGELDTIFINLSQRMAASTFGYLPAINSNVKQHNAYVGNTAWGFVCAETTLYGEQKSAPRDKNSVDVKRNELCSELRQRCTKKSRDVMKDVAMEKETNDCKEAANIYYIADDTPLEEPFTFQRLFLEGTGYHVLSYKMPLFLMAIFFYLLFFVLGFIRLFGFKANFPVGLGCIEYYKRSYVFNDTRAHAELGYKPLYTPEQSRQRSLTYYKKFSYK